mmetsp:Transcript_8416/g.21003  ORF Transcript_8416/g.21003 Transcript_8416/m.21003 type:complete len:206 (+) Transcript_8416:1246-1863(+)
MARDMASTPITRWPFQNSTWPPAFSTRSASSSRSGLWSSVTWMALPARHSTARESPQLAIHIFLLPTSATTAVLPTMAAPASAANSSSVRRNASLSASSTRCVMLVGEELLLSPPLPLLALSLNRLGSCSGGLPADALLSWSSRLHMHGPWQMLGQLPCPSESAESLVWWHSVHSAWHCTPLPSAMHTAFWCMPPGATLSNALLK